ncbi:hypothetical protein [Actinomarinicola tropica]|uniref:PKD domain-containing protein n=1 Tax=Actinomarinicola tropica TaxID=2789776 RepID=A0A5Q2RE80_9ACTN|nr:hypothetical protein [Actinomarinicola tropica]QGG93933.1 hypothetical protein GH723_01770 [Actinomarinicola tropica]
MRQGERLAPRVGHRGGSGNAPSCTYTLVEIPTAAEAYEILGEPPSVDAVPYWLMCGSAMIRPLWVTPDQVVDLDDVVRGEAQRYVETVLGPQLSIGVAPAEFAVTGVPASFWVDGWDGQRIAVPPISPFGETIEVFLDLETVTWDFGDGTTASGDLGAAPPAASTVRHNYTDRSTTPSDPDRGYATDATVTIAVAYRIDGGPEVAVNPPLTATTARPVVVRELQAVLE